jgi:hypothetical protein
MSPVSWQKLRKFLMTDSLRAMLLRAYGFFGPRGPPPL